MAVTVLSPSTQRWLGAAFEWAGSIARLWRDDLASFVPARWKERLGRALAPRAPFIVELDALGGYREVGQSASSLTPEVIRSRTRDSLLALRIDETQLLSRRLSLPSAAVQRLDTALEINLGTWTPFAADEVYAAARPVEQASVSSATLIELRCVVRPLVDAQLATLSASGLDPDSIELGDARFSLFRATRKRRRLKRHRWVLAILAVLLLGQCLAAYVVLASRQRSEFDDLAAARATMVAELRHRTNTEKEARARAGGLLKLVARIDEEHSISRALQLLAAVLPSDSVIREFELGRDRAEGHAAIVGPAGLDVTTLFSKTGIYRVRVVSVLPANEPERKVFSVGFEVIPWTRSDKQAVR